MKIKLMAGAGMLFILGLLALLTKPRKAAKAEPVAAQKPEPKKEPRQAADDERRALMAEMGRKGAEKSAAVRRAKKAAREAAKNASAVPA